MNVSITKAWQWPPSRHSTGPGGLSHAAQIIHLNKYSFACKYESTCLYGKKTNWLVFGIYEFVTYSEVRCDCVHFAHWMRQWTQPKNCTFGVNTTIQLEKYNNYIRQHRHTCQLPNIPLGIIIVRCSCYIFELDCSINSKLAICGLCHSSIQWAMYSEIKISTISQNLLIHILGTHATQVPKRRILSHPEK
jgi:hypothetical protein